MIKKLKNTLNRNLIFLISISFSSTLGAQNLVPTVIVSKQDQTGPLESYSTAKVEKISKEKFDRPDRQTLADLVKDQVGIDTQVYCSNCGAKRLSINGLKAEHTSILIDGLPLHSAVSSFYGVDSVPVNGISDIEVMRGSGASLTNPEAIGGTLNLVTVNPLERKQIYTTSFSSNDYATQSAQNHSFLVSLPSESKKMGLSFGGQFSENKAWDEDDNGVAESPRRQNQSALIKARVLPSKNNDISVRFSYSELEILGGATNASRLNRVREVPANESDFENQSVEEQYIGDPNKITDWIDLERFESSLHWMHYLGQDMTIEWNSGFARQKQRAIYQHGFDYANNDNTFVSDLSLQWLAKKNHLIKTGLFYKGQRLRSASDVLFEQKDIPADNFDHNSSAIYANYTYIASEKFEADFALRVDKINVNWLDLSNKIDDTVVAPRFQLRHNFSEHLTQRLSYGLGYRSPLTFFESQHGNEENGYQVDIDKLEKADSVVYTLSYNTPTYYITYGAHYTHLKNMAYGFESINSPIFYRNSDQSYEIWATDLLLGHQITPKWMLEASLEYFKYQDGYTGKLPTAAIEERLQLKSSYKTDKWQHYFTASLVGARDLSRYGRYSDHYVDRNQFPPPETRGDKKKDQKSPAFFVLDTSFNFNMTKTYQLGFGINNILDTTQVGLGDNPSAWHWHFDHAHYDGLHTWGPNRGREFYLQLSATI